MMMTRIHKTVLRLLALVMAALLPALSASSFTYAAKTPSCAFIKATYSSDITPAKGDTFSLTYKINGESGDGKISVDASKYASAVGYFLADANNYLITDIEYKGKNDTIKSEGYACSSQFTAAGNNKGTVIYIAIGKKAREEFASRNQDAVVTAGTSDGEDGASDADSSSSDDDSADTGDSSSDGSSDSSDAGDSSSSDSEKKPKVTYYSDKAKKADSESDSALIGLVIRLVPLAVISIVGIIVIIILHKKKVF